MKLNAYTIYDVASGVYIGISRSASNVVLMPWLRFDTFYFFVPYRILWDNFEKFMGAQDDPADTISYTIPIMSGSTAIPAV